MTDEVFALLLDKRTIELTEKAQEEGLNKVERAELRAITSHYEKSPAVVHRIRILAAKMAQPSRWALLKKRFCKKFRQNVAELEALMQYGDSKAAWEIAYLSRKKAFSQLSKREVAELEFLTLYHDSPDVLRITQLKVKERMDWLDSAETRELSYLQRNLYRKEGVPNQLMDLLWPASKKVPHTAAAQQELFQLN
jgi:hypothetical protein